MKLQDSMFRIKGWTEDGSTVSVRITLLSQHVIYQAHFPGQPVTPGVCILQIISELLETRLQEPLSLSLVKNMKFVKPISPIDDAELEIPVGLVHDRA